MYGINQLLHTYQRQQTPCHHGKGECVTKQAKNALYGDAHLQWSSLYTSQKFIFVCGKMLTDTPCNSLGIDR